MRGQDAHLLSLDEVAGSREREKMLGTRREPPTKGERNISEARLNILICVLLETVGGRPSASFPISSAFPAARLVVGSLEGSLRWSVSLSLGPLVSLQLTFGSSGRVGEDMSAGSEREKECEMS